MVQITMLFFWVWASCGLVSICQRFETHTVSIFRTKVVMLQSGGFDIVLEKGKAEGVVQSRTKLSNFN